MGGAGYRIIVSGQVVLISGQVVRISGEEVRLRSGDVIITKISGEVVIAKVSGEPVQISGQTIVAKVSGEPVRISGQTVISKVSGELVGVRRPQILRAPINVTVTAVPQALTSGDCFKVILKAPTANAGDIYVGSDSDPPSSGKGLLLEPGDMVSIEIDNMGRIQVLGSVAGDKIAYLGVDYP